MVSGSMSQAKRIVSWIVSGVSPGRPRINVPWIVMPSSLAFLVNSPRDIQAHALLDVVQDLLVAGFVAHQQQPQAVVAHDFERLARHVGLGVARPGHPQLAQAPGDLLGARQIVGERVVVEEELAHLREILLGGRHFRFHAVRAAHAVAVPAKRLRPQAKCALRAAAPAGVQRDVRMLQVADEIVLDGQVALVDVHHIRQRVHVFDRGPRRGEADLAVVAIGDARHLR